MVLYLSKLIETGSNLVKVGQSFHRHRSMLIIYGSLGVQSGVWVTDCRCLITHLIEIPISWRILFNIGSSPLSLLLYRNGLQIGSLEVCQDDLFFLIQAFTCGLLFFAMSRTLSVYAKSSVILPVFALPFQMFGYSSLVCGNPNIWYSWRIIPRLWPEGYYRSCRHFLRCHHLGKVHLSSSLLDVLFPFASSSSHRCPSPQVRLN